MLRPGFRPLPVAIAAAAGIALAPALDRIAPALWPRWLAATALALGLVSWVRWRHRRIAIALALALGAARGAQPPVAAPPGATLDDRRPDRVVGEIRGPVVHGPHGDGALLDTGEVEIWLWTDAALVPGERIAATGMLHTPRGPRDPGVPDRKTRPRARGAALELTAREHERLGDASGPLDRVWRWASATQGTWAHAIDQAGGDPAARAALRGIITGDRGDVPPSLDQRWRAAGIYHVLSVSGLHLAVVAGLLFAALRRLIAASPWGGRTRPARWAAPPALVLAVAYTLITGAQLATLRALAVITLVLIAQMLDRPLRLVDALGLAALGILAWRPADLHDPSFQLSFVAALTLALGPEQHGAPRGVAGWVVRGLRTSVWVAITTAPVTGYHFHQVTAGGVLGNLVLTPLVELVALPLGLAGVLLGAAPGIAAAAWIVGLADRGAELLALITPVGRIAVAGAVTMAVLVGLSLWLATHADRPRRGLALPWLALCLVWTHSRTPPPVGALRVTFLDVGQGDAAVIELPGGEVWLVDAGGNASARDLAQAAGPGRIIDRVLEAYDHTRIALAIVSHPHPDHYLGLAGLETAIDELWTAEAPEDRPPREGRATLPGFTEIAAQLARRGTRLGHPPLGVARTRDGVELSVLAPRYRPATEAPERCAADPVRTVNDNSLVIALRYRGRSVLFAGDIEVEGEDELVAAGLGHADVVKVPHHGSRTSSGSELVAATRPGLAVISCGAGNSFGFPAPEVERRWRAVGAEVARTDTTGAVTVTIDARGALEVERLAR